MLKTEYSILSSDPFKTSGVLCDRDVPCVCATNGTLVILLYTDMKRPHVAWLCTTVPLLLTISLPMIRGAFRLNGVGTLLICTSSNSSFEATSLGVTTCTSLPFLACSFER